MKTRTVEHHDKQDMPTMSPVQQARLGFEILDSNGTVVLRCVSCGRSWTPELSATGHILPKDMICPEKCNL